MSLLELDEDILKIIARKACSVDTVLDNKGTHSPMRLVMPSLCLRLTNRVFRQLASHEQVREKIYHDLELLRSFFISNTVVSVFNAITDGPSGALVQMHTLEKDGIFFHIQVHTDQAGVLYQAHEMIGKRDGNTTRNGIMQGLDMPDAWTVAFGKRTPKQQDELVEWGKKIKDEMLVKWARIFLNLHSNMAENSLLMFQDLE
jgi:hypothetical protein